MRTHPQHGCRLNERIPVIAPLLIQHAVCSPEAALSLLAGASVTPHDDEDDDSPPWDVG